MGIADLFSTRQKRLKGDTPDVYKYDEIPESLRVQIIHIIRDTLGEDTGYNTYWSKDLYQFIHKALCKEYGVFTLKNRARSEQEAVIDYFLTCEDYEHCLDIIELTFRLIENHVKANYYQYEHNTSSCQKPDDAINELNFRLRESGIGYQYESGELIRVDSQFLHSEVVKPVLVLLVTDKKFKGANQEFLTAHEHYRHKRYKECLNECLKSFESLMKAIHEKHSWSYNKNDTAKKLISSCLQNKLVPEYLQNQFASVRILLESGIPTVRNKEGGHGQGTKVSNVPEHLASYTLHLTATNLLFLAKCEADFR